MKTLQFTFILILVAVIAGGFGWYAGNSNQMTSEAALEQAATATTPVVQIPVPETQTEVVLPTLDGLVLDVPESGELVTITRSEPSNTADALYSGSFGESNAGFVAVIDNRLTALNETTFVVPFAVSNNGSGTFSYLALLTQNSSGLSHDDSYFLGDRIRIADVIGGRDADEAIVTILDRHAGQAMSEDPVNEVTLRLAAVEQELALGGSYRNVEPSDASASAVMTSAGIEVSGLAPEAWFFEGDFPIELLSTNLDVIATSFATRTTPVDYENPSPTPVAFTGVLEGIELEDGVVYYLRLMRDNASEDRSLDASFMVRI